MIHIQAIVVSHTVIDLGQLVKSQEKVLFADRREILVLLLYKHCFQQKKSTICCLTDGWICSICFRFARFPWCKLGFLSHQIFSLPIIYHLIISLFVTKIIISLPTKSQSGFRSSFEHFRIFLVRKFVSKSCKKQGWTFVFYVSTILQTFLQT